MLFGKYLTKYYIKYMALFIIGIAALIFVDYVSTEIPLLLGDIVNDFDAYMADQQKLLDMILRIVVYSLVQ